MPKKIIKQTIYQWSFDENQTIGNILNQQLEIENLLPEKIAVMSFTDTETLNTVQINQPTQETAAAVMMANQPIVIGSILTLQIFPKLSGRTDYLLTVQDKEFSRILYSFYS